MALRDELLDSAISAAKEFSHPRVETRHVMYAIARRFRSRDDVSPLFTITRQALEPRGTAHGTPELAPEISSVLSPITGEHEAVTALLTSTSAGKRPSGAATASATAQSQGAAPAATPVAAAAKPRETAAEILAELDALVGLDAVKAQVKSVIAVVQANTERAKAGLKPVNPSLHLVFTGPPGTGKTTVARIIARLYAAIGALPGAGFTEASRADLIAGYVGQTAIKTTEVIARTRPGVLFIDEAYALTPRGDVDFGAEAIATLVKAMEDHRDDFAVIVAGYGEEMAGFVSSNPGLRSRFKTYIDFPDYRPPELLSIFELMARDWGIGLGAGVREKAEQVLGDAAASEAFGNARFVRSLFEQAYARMAARAATDGRISLSELREIIPEDVLLDLDTLKREQRRIGF